MKCKYCDKEFSTAGNLKIHQTKTKKCLALQNKKATVIYKCTYCEKDFTRKDAYENHILRHENNPVEQETYRLKQDNLKLLEENERLKEEIRKYETRINKYERTIEKLATKAISAKSVTNNNNYNNNTYISVDILTPVNTRLIGHHTPHDFTFDVICPIYSNGEMVLSGGACIAKWLLENPLKNNIWCSDVQRQIMKYRSENIIISDVKGRKLWGCVFDIWGLYLDDYLTMTISKLRRREGLTDDEEGFINKLESIKYDLEAFRKYNAETNTEKEFIKYLSENAHTKESLMRFFAEQERLAQSENLITE